MKRIARVNGVKSFEALFTMTNEYEEIVAQTFVASTNHDQLQQTIDDFYKTKNTFKHEPIQCLYIDNCCQDRAFYQKHRPDLALGLSSLPFYDISTDQYTYISSNDPLCLAVQITTLNAQCGVEDIIPVGFDAEWATNLNGIRDPLGMIQLSVPSGTK